MYSVRLKNGDELYHYGVKGMKWGKHLFGLARLKGNMTNTMETDTGTGANNKSLDASSIIGKIQAQRAARSNATKEMAAKRISEAEQLRAQAEAEKAAKKKKKSGSGGKKSSAKAKKDEEVDDEETKTEEQKEAEAKTPDLPPELVEKLQDLNAELTPEEIKMRSENGVAKAKELLATLPSDPTEDDIYALLDKESDKRGTGYDAFTIGIAIDTAMIKLMSKKISDPNSDDKTVADAQQKRSQHEDSLKNSLRTGKASY
jgi:hypothetical protein